MRNMYLLLVAACLSFSFPAIAQTGTLSGKVTANGKNMAFVSISIPAFDLGTYSRQNGSFLLENIPVGNHSLRISYLGYESIDKAITIGSGEETYLEIALQKVAGTLDEVVVTGTMSPIKRSESPVPIEIITPELFHKNPTPSLFCSVGMINGVRSQLNCNVCNTGDIHINGMEGPYTMILIDGMPIVSGLSTVYGLSGIPNSLVDHIEIVKGPASSLYGSEAMGGIINVITKNPQEAPLFSADVFATGWRELSTDVSVKWNAGEKASSLLGINYYNYQNPMDHNNDGFTDVTLQHRISIFNKWNFERKGNRQASLAARYMYEDRWGGQMNWSPKWRGSDSIYGESIFTNRFAFIGKYQLPVSEKIFTQFSYVHHNQNSWYGHRPYMANQDIFFIQAYWDKKLSNNHQLLLGSSFRYTSYDDNSPATASPDGRKNNPSKTPLPGIFIQDLWTLNEQNTLLTGYRYDYDNHHGSVHSPRIAYKLSPNHNNTIRVSLGSGFRVVNLFTEDHAALTGARKVIITEELNPERSFNGNLNYVLKIPTANYFLQLDATLFYSYFTNKIVGDFDTDPNKIIYKNLTGHAVSRGISLNSEITFNFPLHLLAGISYMEVYQVDNTKENHSARIQQLHAPRWSGTFTATYDLPHSVSIDLTGQWTGPMRLPIQPHDYRPEYSPWFCLANIQITKSWKEQFEVYGGVKNIFDFVPQYSFMRPFDPFDKQANNPVTNPYGYTFDTEYNYAPIQGARIFLGFRYHLFK